MTGTLSGLCLCIYGTLLAASALVCAAERPCEGACSTPPQAMSARLESGNAARQD